MRRHWIRWLPLLVVVAGGGAGATMAASAATAKPATVNAATSKTFGMMLVAANGHTLYRFLLDAKGVSRCTGPCAAIWPGLLVKAGVKPTAGAGASASLLGTIKAAHGMAQVTYAGYPLYLYAGDSRSGMTTGEGLSSFKAKWYLVNTRGVLVTKPVKTTSTTTTSSSTGGGWG